MPDSLEAIFGNDREWLESQPCRRPWAKGCRMLVDTLQAWLDEHYRQACDKPPPTDRRERIPYLLRLWRCWSYHWRKTVDMGPRGRVDGRRVAQEIQAGRDCTGRALGGNPLRDVVLAEALLHDEPSAAELFTEEYRAVGLDAMARILGREVRDNWQLWWDALRGHIGMALRTYEGRSTLKGWI
jgi:hypothetical protein